MPWKIFKNENGKYVVHKLDASGDPTGDPLGTHNTEAEATAQQRALYASENKKAVDAVKFADVAETEIEGLGMPFGGPFNGSDLAGEKFTAKTDFAFDWFPEGRPLLYHHGLDSSASVNVVGRVKSWETKTDLGIWTKCQLDASSEYFSAIKDLIKAGKLYFSSGSMRHLVDVGKSGEIKRWPWVELSLTPTPCNLYAELDFASAEKHYEAAGIKADLSALKLDSSDMPEAGDEDISEADQKVLETLEECIGVLTGFSDEEVEALTQSQLGDLIALTDEFIDSESTKAGGHSGHGGQHSGHGGAGGMGPIAKKAARKRVMGKLEGDRAGLLADIKKMRTMKLTSPNAEVLRRESIKGAQTELASVRKKMVAARAKYKSFKAMGMPMMQQMVKKMAADMEVDMSDSEMEMMMGEMEGMDEDEAKEHAKKKMEKMAQKAVSPDDPMSLTVHAEMTKAFAAGLVERTKDLRERRIKEGRMLSTSNRKKLSDCLSEMRSACDAMQTLLDATEPTAKAGDVERARARFKIFRLRMATLN